MLPALDFSFFNCSPSPMDVLGKLLAKEQGDSFFG
jgi:hypothetical protein